jgi:hypothetical protein
VAQSVLDGSPVAKLRQAQHLGALKALLAVSKERGVGKPHWQGLLLDVLERICSVDTPALAPTLTKACELLYDANLLAEEVVLKWYAREFAGNAAKHPAQKAAHVAARKGAAVFVAWLQNAEEESD